MQQYLIINHQSGKPFLMGAEIDLFLEPRLWVSKLISKLETGNWIHEKNKLRASMTSVVTSIHNFKQESLFRIKACRGVAFCKPGSSLAPLHLSRTLYKSALFMQNKPNLPDAQMNVNSLVIMDYKNKRNWTLSQNKPNQTQFKANSKPISKIPKMSLNIYHTIDYNNKNAFRRIQNKPKQSQNKPNFKPCPERSLP